MDLSFYNTRCLRNALPYKPNIMTRKVDCIEIIGNIRYYEECDSLQATYKDWECWKAQTIPRRQKLLNDLQFGFRPDRSTHTSIHTMLEYIAQWSMNESLVCNYLSNELILQW